MKPDFIPVYSQAEEETIRSEFTRAQGVCYLDQAGSALYTKSQIERVSKDLCENLYSNPHSKSTSGRHCQDTIDQVRYRVLQHFNTDVDQYSVIFTSGASASLKLVAEAFLWSKEDEEEGQWLPKYEKDLPKGEFVYMEDNHTSVLGMRDVINAKGVNVRCLPHDEALELLEKSSSLNEVNSTANSLFVYSAQCNFSGVKYPLSWIQRVHEGALQKQSLPSTWYVLLDAACFLSTNTLDLSLYKPDFVAVSFYKIFGFPTGLGALLVRNERASLRKRFYGGGTVQVALSSELAYVPRPILHESFEDGTIDFLSILALLYGFQVAFEVLGGFEKLSRHTFSLAKYLFNRLLALHHGNGAPAVQLYADSDYSNEEAQGGIVNFNMVRSNGEFIGFAEVQNMANLYNIQLRTGCFCNPGACKRHLSLSTEDVKSHFDAGHVCGDDKDLVDGRPTGSVRVSFGVSNTLEDAEKLVQMLVDCFVDNPVWKTPKDWRQRGQTLAAKFSQSKVHPLFNGISQQGVKLSSLFLYPVKSCGALAVDKWTMDEKGLQYDRLWMVTDHNGVPLTQKKEPKLCLIKPEIDLVSQQLLLTFLGADPCSIPLNPLPSLSKEVALCQSKVCGDRVQGLDCGEEVALWLSDVLLRPGLRLIRQVPEDKRSTKTSNALSLNNQAQFLLISEASVAWLAEQISDESDCSKGGLLHRFRSNFVLSGVQVPFDEQKWSEVVIGGTKFGVEGPCRRCQMICIDQETGELTREPLTTISATCQGKLFFGIYLYRRDVLSGPTVISVDSQVTFS